MGEISWTPTRGASTTPEVPLPFGGLSSDAGSDWATTHYLSKREMGVDIGRATTRAHPPHPLPTRPYYTTNRPTKPSIVGAGEDMDAGMGPWWLPVLPTTTSLLLI